MWILTSKCIVFLRLLNASSCECLPRLFKRLRPSVSYHAGGRDFWGIPLPEDLFIVTADGGARAVFFSVYPQVRCPRPGNNADETH